MSRWASCITRFTCTYISNTLLLGTYVTKYLCYWTLWHVFMMWNKPVYACCVRPPNSVLQFNQTEIQPHVISWSNPFWRKGGRGGGGWVHHSCWLCIAAGAAGYAKGPGQCWMPSSSAFLYSNIGTFLEMSCTWYIDGCTYKCLVTYGYVCLPMYLQ